MKYFKLVSLCSLILNVNGQANWVWNRDGVTSNDRFISNNRDRDRFNTGSFETGNRGNGGSRDDPFFVGHSSNRPASPKPTSSDLPPDTIRNIRINLDSQGRLIPSAADFITNSILGNSGSNNNGGNNGFISTALQTLPTLASQALQILLGRPGSSGGSSGITTLPGINGVGKEPSDSTSGFDRNCKCVSSSTCFLPFRVVGTCGSGGTVRCCCCQAEGTRTIFEDEGSRLTKDIANNSPNRNLEIRRGLIQSIFRGSGQVVDDTLDLLLRPFLTQDDQEKIGERITRVQEERELLREIRKRLNEEE